MAFRECPSGQHGRRCSGQKSTCQKSPNHRMQHWNTSRHTQHQAGLPDDKLANLPKGPNRTLSGRGYAKIDTVEHISCRISELHNTQLQQHSKIHGCSLRNSSQQMKKLSLQRQGNPKMAHYVLRPAWGNGNGVTIGTTKHLRTERIHTRVNRVARAVSLPM